MGIIRPATPGFIATLTATVLLAVVSFCVPYFKAVFFLKASVTGGTITFGTLGYCLELANGTVCSKPSIGYQLDINSLVGDHSSIQIPQVAVKWITYALVLHIVALALSAGSAVFGLLAHIREMSMTCCSTCVSGFAAAVAFLAFVFDLALFFIAKSRINAVGTASLGNAIWLTVAAWVLLLFSGCFYTLGRCCISNRGPRNKGWNNDHERGPSGIGGIGGAGGNGYNDYADQMRMDAVKAETDRKARQKEVGLPAFAEIQPLTARVDGDSIYSDPYQDTRPAPPSQPAYGQRTPHVGGYADGGYMQAPVGSRAIDEYYSPTRENYSTAAAYPPQPQPQRQLSSHTYAPSNYAPSIYDSNTTAPNQFLAPAFTHDRSATAASTGSQGYGHTGGGTTYHSAHEQYPSNYSQYEQPQADGYGHSHYYGASAVTNNYGADSYGANSVPPLPERSGSMPALPEHPSTSGFVPYSSGSPSPSHRPMPVAGMSNIPGPQRSISPQNYDAPPVYDAGVGVTGHWGKS
ncbi:hypothetical protein D9757_010833 [Collybiopsis confluens]|uniref:Pali-domain-containing protein n=1 Tax=Collybiopsis confluens TaxID=2823264 RepID=A0A8H5GL08_9AGAR|nr:hypothetical protein D9757_010833 [Collybiopsis confluens]